MKDPDRLGISGTEEDRRLLRAAQSVRVPERIKEEVRRTLEDQLQARPRTLRRLVIGAGMLIAATAAAAGVPQLWKAMQAPQVPAEQPAVAGDARPIVVATPAPASHPPPPPPPASPPRRAEGHSPASRTASGTGPAPTLTEGPALDLPGFLRGASEPAKAAPTPPPTSGRLVIARSDRGDVSLEATATTVRGEVRGRGINLALAGNTITGRIGGDAVLVRIFGNVRAEGHVGGQDIAFRFTPSERGWIVKASLPNVGASVKLDGERLSFHPGCDHELRAVAQRPGVYQGDCSDDTRLRVALPAGFLQMPALARLVVLGMLLPEPEPLLRGKEPGLFPPP